jgi:hypothetical protein
MLHDSSKWGKIKSPPVTLPPTTANEVLRGLVVWLEGQPGGTEYCWADHTDYLFARYSKVFKTGEHHSYGRLYGLLSSKEAEKLGEIELEVAVPEPETYAAALERARALL